MATDIDELYIKINADSDKANQAVDNLCDNIGKLAKSLEGISGKKVKGIENVEKQANEISDLVESIAEKYKDIGKGFELKGSTLKIQKEVDNLYNALARATIKKDEMLASGDINGKMFDYAVRDTIKFQNQIESLENQLQSLKKLTDVDSSNIQVHGLDAPKKSLQYFEKSLKEYKDIISSGGEKSVSGTVFPTRGMEMALEQLKSTYPQAEQLISSYEAEIQHVSEITKSMPKMGNVLVPIESFMEQFEKKVPDASENLIQFENLLENLEVPKINVKNLDELDSYIKREEDALEKLYVKFDNSLSMGKITKSVDDKGYVRLREQIALTEKTLEALNEMKPELEIKSFEESFKKMMQSEEQLKTFRNNLEKLEVPEVKEENIDKLRSSIEKTKNKLEELRIKLLNGISMGTITESVDDKGYVRLREQIALTEKQLNALIAKFREVENENKGNFFTGFKNALLKLVNVSSKVVNTFSKIGSSFSKIGSSLSNFIKGIVSANKKIVKFGKSLLGIKDSNKKVNSSFSDGIKKVLSYSLGIRSLYSLFNKLRKAFMEGIKNLVQYSSETNASVSLLNNSLTQLKNATAAMVSPLLNALAPALNQIIQICINAVNVINQLISSLVGKSTWIRAKTLTDNYAASLDKTSSSAKKTKDNIQKGVRAFDELKEISTDDDSGNGNGYTATSPANMFETVSVDADISDFAQKIKEAWENADFTEIGTILGTKLKNALDSIDWQPIQETVGRIGTSLATLLNGFVEVDGFGYSIGQTLGESINTGVMGINAFLDNTHWESVGQFLGEGANGVVDSVSFEDIGHNFAQKWNAIFETFGEFARTFDWTNLGLELSNGLTQAVSDFNWSENGARLSDFVSGFLDTIITFFEQTNWQEIGNNVADFMSSIDWNELSDKLFEGIGAALGGIAGFLWGLIEDAWNDVVDWWKDTAYEDGEFTMQGLFDGIIEKFRNIGAWIEEHIFLPFINGFKNAFGIHSPSTVMKEQGNFLMQGLLNGINELVDNVKQVFNNLKEKILLVWEKVKTKTSTIWNGIKQSLSNIWNGVSTSASNIFTGIKNKITNIWESLKTVTTNVWNGIKNAIKTPINAIIGFINSLIGGVESGMNAMVNALNQLSFSVPDWIPSIGGNTFGFNLSPISIAKIPQLETGGFVPKSYSLFMAGENGIPELMGTVGGKTAVAGGVEITGISDAIRATSNEEVKLLRQQNALLQAILEKEYGISKDDIGKAAQSWARDYSRRTGREAYSF